MLRPRLESSPGSDHQRHDVLLVAQYAAGDALDDDRQREASALLSGCGDCASLAADLRAISAAVAWEPVPPRRRDFRIDAPTAERLRGSPFARFRRRLSLPQTRALSPAAVGVMSIGLLFVVAGSVWPAADPGLSGVPAVVAPADEVLYADEVLSAAESPLADGSLAQEPLLQESLADSLAAALEMPADDVAGNAATPEDQAAEKAFRAAAPEAGSEQDRESLEVPLPETGLPEGSEPEAFALDRTEETLGQGAETEAAAAPEAAVDDPGAAEMTAGTVVVADEPTIASVLLVVGAVLAVAGALLLLLTWLARRSIDPLLR